MADHHINERLIEWHPVDADQMEVYPCDDPASADRQFYSCDDATEEFAT